MLDFVAGHANCRAKVGDTPYESVFDAVLLLKPPASATSRVRSFKFAALEAAVLSYPDALDVACGRIVDRMRELGISGGRVASLVREANEISANLAKGAMEGSNNDGISVHTILNDAPVDANATVPPGWTLSPDGIARIVGGLPEHRIGAPVLVTGRLAISAAGSRC